MTTKLRKLNGEEQFVTRGGTKKRKEVSMGEKIGRAQPKKTRSQPTRQQSIARGDVGEARESEEG
jgi:hypothetical protein